MNLSQKISEVLKMTSNKTKNYQIVISAKQKLVLIDLLRYCLVTGLIVHYFQV